MEKNEKREVFCSSCRTGKKTLWWNWGRNLEQSVLRAQRKGTRITDLEKRQREVRRTLKGLWEVWMQIGVKKIDTVMNRDTRTFLFSVVSIFTFLFLEWTYIIGKSHDQSHDMSHDHRGRVVHRPSRIGISSILKSSGNSNKFSLSTLT